MRRALALAFVLASCGPAATHLTVTAPASHTYRDFSDVPTPTTSTTTSTSTSTTTTSTTEVPTTTTEPARPSTTTVSRSAARTDLNWEALRQCESGNNYSDDTGNGYFGAYQFDQKTWYGLGYEGLPSDAPPSTQDEAARRLYEARGASPWPNCGARL